jgi:hypothetical protein
MTPVAPFNWLHLIWIPMFAGMMLALVVVGTPHLLFRYSYVGSPDLFGLRHYYWCEYVGWHAQRVYPRDGRCPIIRLLKQQEAGND